MSTPAVSQEITTKTEASPELSGVTDKFLDGTSHFGVAVVVTSGAGESTLMIPDAGAGEPVYITKPIMIEGTKLKAFLQAKGITLPAKLANVIADAKIGCGAFYYSKEIMLLLFVITFDKGLLTSLTDASLSDLFDVKGASLRIFKCPKASFGVLQRYVAGLSAESA